MIDVHCPEGGRHEVTVITTWNHDARAYCIKCLDHDLLDHEDIERLLNAAMQLSADEAEQRVRSIVDATLAEIEENPGVGKTDLSGLRNDEPLVQYARRWRGDTEESE